MEENPRPTKRQTSTDANRDREYSLMLVEVAKHLDKGQVIQLARLADLTTLETDEISQKNEGWPDILFRKLERKEILHSKNASWLRENLKILPNEVAVRVVEKYIHAYQPVDAVKRHRETSATAGEEESSENNQSSDNTDSAVGKRKGGVNHGGSKRFKPSQSVASSSSAQEPATPADDIPKNPTKVFNDPVHGHIEVHPLLVSIIDTLEFQRLRYIKQLGMCYLVYPGASHNRFEHSLGVSYLAGKLVRTLRAKQGELNITDEDILCVEIAGLCHDLGHGPFSHLFEQAFIPAIRPAYDKKHEKLSGEMFEHMLQKNNLREEFKKYRLGEGDITFIKEQIVGAEKKQVDWPHEGRGEDKRFLYEIVANKRNGIDVDKWDYFARDCYHLGIRNSFDWKRFLKFARVLNSDDGKQICTRDKQIVDLYDMFHTRYTLHRRAYQHRVCTILEDMMVEALIEADDHLKFPGQNGKMCKMSESIDDMEAYCQVTDNIMWTILTSKEKKLEKSRKIIERITKRDLYRCVGQTILTKTFQHKKETESIEKSIHALQAVRIPLRDDSEIRREEVQELKEKCKEAEESLEMHLKNMGEHDPKIHDGKFTEAQMLHPIPVVENSAREEIYQELSVEAREEISINDLIVHITSFSYGMGEKDPVEHVQFYSKHDQDRPVGLSSLISRHYMSLPREFSERFLSVCVKDRKFSELVREAFNKWCDDKQLSAKPGEMSSELSIKKKPQEPWDRSEAASASRRLDYGEPGTQQQS